MRPGPRPGDLGLPADVDASRMALTSTTEVPTWEESFWNVDRKVFGGLRSFSLIARMARNFVIRILALVSF